MAIHQPTQAGDSKQAGLLDELIQRKGLQPGEYALFFITGEGAIFPPAVARHRRSPKKEAVSP